LKIIDKLKKYNLTDNIKEQISKMENNLINGEDYDVDILENSLNITDPVEISKLLRLKLSSTTSFRPLQNSLQQLLILSSQKDDEKIENTWKNLEKALNKSIETGEFVYNEYKEQNLKNQLKIYQDKV
jgi:hypothetical protein